MSYEGLLVALNEPIPDTEVLDDEDAEHEAHSPDAWTIVNRGVDNHSTGIQANDEQAAPRWNQTLESASTGITGRTEEEYKRLIRAYEKWLRDNNFIEAQDDVFAEDISPDTPNYIAMFIMDTCDEITLSGSPRPPQVYRGTHAHGMKIRSALTYGYGRLPSRGRLPWHQTDQGTWRGNPSVSERVSRYMLSLHRRKVRNGETAQSSRAITPSILRRLADYNHQPHIWSIDGAVTLTGDKEENGAIWGGGRTRRLLECAYTLAFWCLLRFDEVMQIKTQHLVVVSETCIQLTLPFRKTHQCGGIKPFYLHRMPIEDAFMCPVRALARWIELTKAPPGYLFPPVRRGDKIGSSENHISGESFLELFRNNLLDIGIDPNPYGTHSFRRGGCQWLSSGCRWPLRRICEWGGWSLNFTHMSIVKYLISWNDDPSEPREDFLNPNRNPTMQCHACGRRCHCV